MWFNVLRKNLEMDKTQLLMHELGRVNENAFININDLNTKLKNKYGKSIETLKPFLDDLYENYYNDFDFNLYNLPYLDLDLNRLFENSNYVYNIKINPEIRRKILEELDKGIDEILKKLNKEIERITEEYDRIEEEEENQSASYVDYRFDSTGKIDEQHWKRILEEEE